jgi:hypothetical protein
MWRVPNLSTTHEKKNEVASVGFITIFELYEFHEQIQYMTFPHFQILKLIHISVTSTLERAYKTAIKSISSTPDMSSWPVALTKQPQLVTLLSFIQQLHISNLSKHNYPTWRLNAELIP